jgi:hypothetical protein
MGSSPRYSRQGGIGFRIGWLFRAQTPKAATVLPLHQWWRLCDRLAVPLLSSRSIHQDDQSGRKVVPDA